MNRFQTRSSKPLRFSFKDEYEITDLWRIAMALENKFGINDSAELARVEEKISKTKAIKLYESKIVEDF